VVIRTDLINCGDDVHFGKQNLQILDAKVGDSDGFYFSYVKAQLSECIKGPSATDLSP
jgi:hypothetical protein